MSFPTFVIITIWSENYLLSPSKDAIHTERSLVSYGFKGFNYIRKVKFYAGHTSILLCHFIPMDFCCDMKDLVCEKLKIYKSSNKNRIFYNKRFIERVNSIQRFIDETVEKYSLLLN